MKDDYLWDRSGDPDPEVQQLENLLERYRYQPTEFRHQRTVRRYYPLAAAAAVIFVAALSWITVASMRWEISPVQGAPVVGSESLETEERFSVGQTVVTDEKSRASIRVGRIGEVEVEPSSRVRLLRAWLTDHRIALDRGTIRARISAPPRLFLVETPAGNAVDLGCAYTLQVDEYGFGALRVTAGWVAYEDGGRESFVPAGAACLTRPGQNPGTPYYVDAPRELVSALTRLDFERLSATERQKAVRTISVSARKRDVLTLWHLLSRVEMNERAVILDSIQKYRPEAAADRQAILEGNERAIKQLGKAIGVRKTNWWEFWR